MSPGTVRTATRPAFDHPHVRPDLVLADTASLPPEARMHMWRVIRSLQLWLGVPDAGRAGLFGNAMAKLELDLLRAMYDDGIRCPLAVIAGSLRPGVPVEKERVGFACMCVAEWASLAGLHRVTLAFAHAAACVTQAPAYRVVAELAEVSYALAGPAVEGLDRRELEERRAALLAAIGVVPVATAPPPPSAPRGPELLPVRIPPNTGRWRSWPGEDWRY